jgi:hypothetical protein
MKSALSIRVPFNHNEQLKSLGHSGKLGASAVGKGMVASSADDIAAKAIAAHKAMIECRLDFMFHLMLGLIALVQTNFTNSYA